MSMVGSAARQSSWPRSRILSAVLAVSLVLNVLFVAGAVWSRIEQPPARGLDQRFERIGAQLEMDPAQRAAFNGFIADMRGRRDEIGNRSRRYIVPPGTPPASLRWMQPKCFGISRRRSTSDCGSTARRRREWSNFSRRCRPSSAADLSHSRGTAGENRPARPSGPDPYFVPNSRSPASPSPGRI